MHSVTPWDSESAQTIIREHLKTEGAVLPILHALQHTFGFIHEDAVPMVADALNLSRAEIHGVVTFYHDFRREPPGRHVLQLCRAEACQSRGADDLAEQAQQALGLRWGETAADGSVTLAPVFCLGLCACAPSAMLDGKPVGRLDRQSLNLLLAGVSKR
jgi:formate dehydrogenase subunit gamma